MALPARSELLSGLIDFAACRAGEQDVYRHFSSYPKRQAIQGEVSRSCCRRFFRAQEVHPYLAFCCCRSTRVWHAVPRQEFLRTVERAFCLWVGLARAHPGQSRDLCCFPSRTSSARGCGSKRDSQREFPVYKKLSDRAKRLVTDDGCHAPPCGDLKPRLFRAFAIARRVVAPSDRTAWTTGTKLSANRSAPSIRAARPKLPACAKLRGLPKVAPPRPPLSAPRSCAVPSRPARRKDAT